MKAQTTIKDMLQNKEIVVPAYQRAYSWDTPQKGYDKKTQIDVFVKDIEEYIKSQGSIPYYFGHFLFEKIDDEKYAVVDGQQRLTTITLFIAALYQELKKKRELSEVEERNYRIIKDGTRYGFSTVPNDNMLMRDYAIDHKISNVGELDTLSQKRIVGAYDYFVDYLSRCEESKLALLLDIILKSSCTTHVVNDETEAVQMFIFQNDRGKRPSRLEVVKAHLMYHLLLNNPKDVSDVMLTVIQERFGIIYANLSRLEQWVDEDNLLQYALRIYRNTLDWVDVDAAIAKELAKEKQESIAFVEDFVALLQECSKYLVEFYINDERAYYEIHSLAVLGLRSDIVPFIIKAYKHNVSKDALCRLSRALERITLRDKLIGTRAALSYRLIDVFRAFDGDVALVEQRVDKLCTSSDWWWAYWNNSQFEASIRGRIDRNIAKYILWKYENSLIGNGYMPMRYSMIQNPELEHIAPQTRPDVENCGYCEYDDEFNREYLDCLGNYLLLSKSHNCSASNNVLSDKLKSYTQLKQQQEVVELVGDSNVWDKNKIAMRRNWIVDFVMSEL